MTNGDNTEKKKRGIFRLLAALGYSFQGLWMATWAETAFRQEIVVLLSAMVLLIFLPFHNNIKLALVLCHVGVMVVELLNSAIECIVDMVTSDYHILAKKAKDYGSAAVFLTLLITASVWIFAFWYTFF